MTGRSRTKSCRPIPSHLLMVLPLIQPLMMSLFVIADADVVDVVDCFSKIAVNRAG